MGVSNVSLLSCVASGRRARTLRSPCAASRATLHTILEAALGSAALQTTLGSPALQTTLGSPALQAALDAALGSATLETALDLSECVGRRCQNGGREDDPFTQHEALPFWAYPGLAAIPSPKRRPTDGTATYFSCFTGSVSIWPSFATHFLK